MPTSLVRSKIEEENRRKKLYEEATKLEQIVKNSYNKTSINSNKKSIKHSMLKLINADIHKISNLKLDIKDLSPSSALKTNKLLDLFECTYLLLANEFDSSIIGNLTTSYSFNPNKVTILYGTKAADKSIIDYFGTSKLNCIQNTYITILRFYEEATNIRELHILQEIGIFNVNTSPNIQTTSFPINFDSKPYMSWFYYYKDEQSPAQGELLVPSLGYAYGGSRHDARYKDKELRAEDCSSAVSKWVGATHEFSTYHMFMLYEGDPNCDSDPLCLSAKATLLPIKKDISLIIKGNIFCYRSHTGIVTNNYPEEQILETISYSRDMPDLEGLGYRNYSYTEKQFIFFAQISEQIHDEF
jgi:hypothetical protein